MNGLKTRYCHLKRIDVNKGDTVTKGQVVGLTGSALEVIEVEEGLLGSYLHYEVYKDGKTVDPEPYLSGADIINNVNFQMNMVRIHKYQKVLSPYMMVWSKGRRGMRPQVKEM